MVLGYNIEGLENYLFRFWYQAVRMILASKHVGFVCFGCKQQIICPEYTLKQKDVY